MRSRSHPVVHFLSNSQLSPGSPGHSILVEGTSGLHDLDINLVTQLYSYIPRESEVHQAHQAHQSCIISGPVQLSPQPSGLQSECKLAPGAERSWNAELATAHLHKLDSPELLVLTLVPRTSTSIKTWHVSKYLRTAGRWLNLRCWEAKQKIQ